MVVWLGAAGWWLGCDILVEPVSSEELLDVVADLSEDVSALEQRVEELDARRAPAAERLGGTVSLSSLAAMLRDSVDTLSPQRPWGRFAGLRVSRRAEAGLVEELGLEVGDLVVSVHGWPVDTPEAREQVLRTLEVARPSIVTLEILRPGPGDDGEGGWATVTLRLDDE